MEYRGKQYGVVQGLEGATWKGSVEDLDGHTRSGNAPSRHAGITAAERAARRSRPKIKPKAPPSDGGAWLRNPPANG
jgi:hypothetical protein